MRHDLLLLHCGAVPMPVLVLAAHAVATCLLAGVVWVVQLVVYPGFLAVGPTSAWPAFHAAHSRGMTLVVAVPWAVQGAALGLLLLRRPAGVPIWLLLLAAALGLATVVVTLGVSVPLHTRLGESFDADLARRLLQTNWLRTTAWTAAAASGVAMLVLHVRA